MKNVRLVGRLWGGFLMAALFLAFGSGTLRAQDTYVLVTDVSELNDGDEVLIVSASGRAMTAYTDDVYDERKTVAVTVEGNAIINPDIATDDTEQKACVFTLEKNAAGQYAFKDNSRPDQYLSDNKDQGGGYLYFSSTAHYCTIEIMDASTGSASVYMHNVSGGYNYIRYYADEQEFTFWDKATSKGDEGNFCLYKKQGGSSPTPYIKTKQTEVSYTILLTENLDVILSFTAGNLTDDVSVAVESADEGRELPVIGVDHDVIDKGASSFQLELSASGLAEGTYSDIITLTSGDDVKVEVMVNLEVKDAVIYRLVTDVASLKHGDVVLIVSEDGYAMMDVEAGPTTSRSAVHVTIADNAITDPDIATAPGDNKACEFTLEKDADGKWAFNDHLNTYNYLKSATGNNSPSSSEPFYFSITIDASTGVATMVQPATGTQTNQAARYMRCFTGTPNKEGFRLYTTKQYSDIYFYKKQGGPEVPTCEPVTLSSDGATTATENSVKIMWTAPEEGQTPIKYKVTVTGPENYEATKETTATQIEFTELASETPYSYKIVAVCGEGFESDPITGSFSTPHVDNPELEITSPANNTSFTDAVTFEFTTTDFSLDDANHLVKLEVKAQATNQVAAPVLKTVYTQTSPVVISGLPDGKYHVDLYMIDVKGPNDTAVVGFDGTNYVHCNIEVQHPAISLSPKALKLATYRGTAVSGEVTVSGHALPNTSVSFNSSDNNFTITPNSLTQADVMANGGAKITVTYNGAAPSATATITATCGSISATLTVNATAKDTLANLKGIYSRANNDTVLVRGKMVVTHKDSNSSGNTRVWVQDIDRKNGASMLLYRVTASKGYTALKVGDVLENVAGKVNISSGLYRFTPLAERVDAVAHNHAVHVDTMSLLDVRANASKAAAQNALVCIKEVVRFKQTGAFAANRAYALQQDNDTLVFRTDYAKADYIGTAIPTYRLYVTGIVGYYNSTTPQVTARNLADLAEAPCPLPTDITAEDIHANKALLDWNGVADQYSVRYAKTQAGLESATPTTVSQSNFTATNLDELTTYYYQVKSVCRAENQSAWSEVQTFKTLEALKPTIDMVMPIDKPVYTDSVKVQFRVNNVTLKAGDTSASIVFSDGFRVDNYADTVYKRAMPSGNHSVQVILMAHSDTLHPSVQTRVRYFSVNLPDVAKPVFAPVAGHFKDSAEVKLSCGTEGASIFYAKGEGEWVAYTAGSKIVLKESATLKAFACKERMDTSEVATATYIIHRNPTPAGDLVFAENFSKSATASDNPITNFNNVTDMPGWTGENMYPEVNEIKGGTPTKAGKLVSPAIDLSYDNGRYYVAFFARAYNNTQDSTKIRLTAGDKTVLVNDLAKTGMFEYVYAFDNGTANTQLTFEALAAAYNRFYLDNIRVYQELPPMLFASSTLSMDKTVQGVSVRKTVNVKGTKLTGDVTVSCPTGNFSVSKISLDKDKVMSEDGADFTVTYNGSEVSDEVEITLTSGVATKTIKVTATAEPVTEVADLSALRNGTEGQIYKVTGEVILTAQTAHNNYKWIQDAQAGILIDDEDGHVDRTYQIGDGITGVMGRIKNKDGQYQLVPIGNLPEATTHNNPITPIELTVPQLTEDINLYSSRVVKLSGLTLDDPALTDGKWAAGNSYTAKDRKGASIVIYTSITEGDFIGNDLPTGKFNLVGLADPNTVVGIIIPRSKSDFEEIPACNKVVDLSNDVTGSTVTFSWSKPEPAPQVGYAIEVRADDAENNFVKLDTVKDPSTLTYTLGDLTEGKYTYTVTTLCSDEDASEPVPDHFTIVAEGKPSIQIAKPSAGEFPRDSVMCIFKVTNFKLKGDDAEGSVKYTLRGTNLAAPVTATIIDTFFYYKFDRSGKDTLLLELVDKSGNPLETPVTAFRYFTINLPDVATPTFTPTAAFSNEPFEVTIGCDTEDASIFYSLNNSAYVPYAGAIKLDTTGTYAFKAFATKAKMDTSKVASKTYTLRLPKPLDPGVLFYEPFDNLTGAGTGALDAKLNQYTDRPGWTGEAVYMQVAGIARLGSGSKNGYLQTPAIALTEGRRYILTFDAQAWKEDSKEITVTINGTDYTISGLANDEDATGKAPTKMKAFEKEFTATGSTTIRFASATEDGTEGRSRFFLDNIRVVEVTPSLSVSPAPLEMETTLGTPASRTVTVKGVNLDADVTVTCPDGNFSVSATTLTKEAVLSEAGAELTVTFNGSVLSDRVNITLASGEVTKSIRVTATATEVGGGDDPEPEPEITVVATLAMNTVQGTPVSEKVSVKGKDLENDVTVTCPDGNFSVSATTLTKEAVMSEAGAELTVTFNGSVLSDEVEITLASGSVIDTIKVTATATEVVVPVDECDAPTQLKATVDEKDVTLTWNGETAQYRVVVTLGEKEVCNELVEAKSHELKNLEAGVYSWSVASVCESGEQAANGEDFEVKGDEPQPSANEGAEGLAFRIYPNPTTGAFYVEVAEGARMEIFNVGGVMIRNAELSAGKNEIRLDRSGIYFLRLTNAHGAAVNRVIVR